MAQKQYNKLKSFVREKISSCKKEPSTENKNKQEAYVEGSHKDESQRGNCDEVFQDLGTCLKDCICSLDKSNKTGGKINY